jgi:hypothetical protein
MATSVHENQEEIKVASSGTWKGERVCQVARRISLSLRERVGVRGI